MHYKERLRTAGVTIRNSSTFTLQCENGHIWQPIMRPGGDRLPNGYWLCPYGCNDHLKDRERH